MHAAVPSHPRCEVSHVYDMNKTRESVRVTAVCLWWIKAVGANQFDGVGLLRLLLLLLLLLPGDAYEVRPGAEQYIRIPRAVGVVDQLRRAPHKL